MEQVLSKVDPLGAVAPTAHAEVQRAARPSHSARSAPKWEADSRNQIKAAIRKYSKPLADLIARDANEGDTRLLVTDFLCEALGYDKFEELTTEYRVRGEFADYGIRIEKQLVAFVECKRATTKLNARHLRQVEMYAVNEGVEWLILTNGSEWQVYHVTGGLPVQVDPALTVDLFADEPIGRKVDLLFYLSRAALKKRQIDELWRAKKATSPRSLARTLLSAPVAEAIRKELRQRTGHRIEASEVTKLLKNTVLRPECLATDNGTK